MKRILFLLVIFSISLCACNPSNQQVSGNTDPMTGGSEPIADNPEPQSTKMYLLTEEMRYDSKGAPYYKNTYTYDDLGRMTSRHSVRFAYTDLPEVSYTETYTYNEQGYLVSLETDEEYEVNQYFQYSYNEDGTVASYTRTTELGAVTYYIEYEDGRFIRAYILDKEGNKKQQNSCKYDDYGNVSAILGEQFDLATLTYDEQGRLINSFGEPMREYQYDQDRIVLVRSPVGDQSWAFSYTNDVLSGISMSTVVESEFGEFAPRQYILNENGKIAKIQYDNGGWIDYQYKEIDLIGDQNNLRYVYFNVLNEPLLPGDYYRDAIWYVLPKAQPEKSN